MTVLNLDRKDNANARVQAFNSSNGTEVLDATFELKGRALMNISRRKGPLAALPSNFDGLLFFSTNKQGSKRLLVTAKSLALNKNGRAISASSVVCR